MKPKNLKEFKALIERYETITIEEIKEINYIKGAVHRLTGFGGVSSCSICSKFHCGECVYGLIGCTSGANRKTFNRIAIADTPLKLCNAFRARAKHMKTLI